MKNFFISIAMIAALLFLNGCAIIKPVTQLVGGVVGVASKAVGMAANAAAKAAPVVLPLLL